jgi:hypothetical protein
MVSEKSKRFRYYIIHGIFNYRVVRHDLILDRFRLFCKVPKYIELEAIEYMICNLNDLKH